MQQQQLKTFLDSFEKNNNNNSVEMFVVGTTTGHKKNQNHL